MIEHREPAEAVHRIRVMHDALYNFKHDLLGGDAPGVPVSSWSTSLQTKHLKLKMHLKYPYFFAEHLGWP